MISVIKQPASRRRSSDSGGAWPAVAPPIQHRQQLLLPPHELSHRGDLSRDVLIDRREDAQALILPPREGAIGLYLGRCTASHRARCRVGSHEGRP